MVAGNEISDTVMSSHSSSYDFLMQATQAYCHSGTTCGGECSNPVVESVVPFIPGWGGALLCVSGERSCGCL